jgi:hypothetical protein
MNYSNKGTQIFSNRSNITCRIHYYSTLPGLGMPRWGANFELF